MLEMLILVNLSRKMSRIVEEKGLDKTPFIIRLVAFWFAGEIGFALIGVALNGGEFGAMSLVLAVMGAAAGAVLAFATAQNAPPQPGGVRSEGST